MEKVLVTGGCGLLGQHICSGLLKKGYEVIAIDREETGYNDGKDNYSFVECDPTDKNSIAELIEKYDFKAIVHAAFTVDNDFSPIITEEEMKACATADKFIYHYAVTSSIKKIVMLSTSQIYQVTKSREPIREDSDLKPLTNYASMKYASEKMMVTEMQHHKDEVIGCIIRFAPVYTLNFTDNLMAKITDPKDGSLFVYGQGQYGFQLCCVHNLVDFILCFIKNADSNKYSGVYNVSDKLLTSAADIITFMREHHRLGAVVQKSPVGTMSKLKGLFGVSKEEKQNYRYLDMNKVENNNMLDCTRASKLVTFRWDIHNTK